MAQIRRERDTFSGETCSRVSFSSLKPADEQPERSDGEQFAIRHYPTIPTPNVPEKSTVSQDPAEALLLLRGGSTAGRDASPVARIDRSNRVDQCEASEEIQRSVTAVCLPA
jgi:hypothetical protein